MMAELLEAYPNIPNALEWGESDADGAVWAAARANGLSPSQVVKLCFNALDVSVAVGLVEFHGNIPANARDRAKKLAVQFNHPEFLRYVAGKLGSI